MERDGKGKVIFVQRPTGPRSMDGYPRKAPGIGVSERNLAIATRHSNLRCLDNIQVSQWMDGRLLPTVVAIWLLGHVGARQL